MTLGKDAVLHLNSNSSKAEERRPRTIGLLLLCNHITAFFNSAISQVFFLEIEKNVWHYFREIVDEGEKQLNRDFRTTLISLFCAAQSYFFSLVFLLVFFCWPSMYLEYVRKRHCTGPLESVQDFLIKLDIKPLMHLLEIST